MYGPKHPSEHSIFDTSPDSLPPDRITRDGWDCDGFLVPLDRLIRRRRRSRLGPLALKFWNYRRFSVWSINAQTYGCSWDNGAFQPSQINWAIPNFSYADIASRLKSK